MAIMGRDPFGIFQEGEVHTISYDSRQAAGGFALQEQLPAVNRAYKALLRQSTRRWQVYL